MSTVQKLPGEESARASHIWISQPNRQTNFYLDPAGRFTIVAVDGVDPQHYFQADAYSAAKAFVEGKFEVHGDIFEAIRHFSHEPHRNLGHFFFSGLARLEHLRNWLLRGDRRRAAQNIQFHYDRSNEFYAEFLDPRMMYSAAYFRNPGDSLEAAQLQKLDAICRALVLSPGDRFLDIGCGWGGLVTYAAEHFKVKALGCTLSPQQLHFAQNTIEQRSLAKNVSVKLCDYRELDGCFDKIASVGMFEHVGRTRLEGYFKKVFDLLKPGGLFLNRGVIRPQSVSDGPETLFVQSSVFPGGELVHLEDIVHEGEVTGFEIVAMRNLARDYALTCKAWVKNLQKNAARCRALVGDATYRTWLLYLAASTVGFEDGRTGAAQVLFQKCRN
jgi:cyclopropane-fatty-acyl-phospholipid synthase